MERKINRVPFVKTEQEELALLQSHDSGAKREYILWHGFQHDASRKALALGPSTDLIRLQDYLYRSLWNAEAREILYSRFLLTRPSSDTEPQLSDFEKWLSFCFHGDSGNEPEYGKIQQLLMSAIIEFPPIVEESEQLIWFENNLWGKIRDYTGRWKGKAVERFFLEAPEECVWRYLRYRLLKTEEEQYFLVKRDMQNNENALIWNYFHCYRAFPRIQEMIRKYDPALFRHVLLVNYGSEPEFYQKFSCEANWRRKLEENADSLSHYPIEGIQQELAKIA